MTKGSADNNKKGDLRRGRSAPCVRPDTESSNTSGPDHLKDELLPGIPNEIAWQVIAPKLSGTDINTLSLVSPSWREAIYGRWVYDARVNSQSTETFAVVLYAKRQTHKLRLYPLNGNSAYDLPPMPSDDFGSIKGYKCIPLDGKLYILGGAITGSNPCHGSCPGSRKLFMLDLAGHKQWKQCSSMQEGRHSFSAGVLDGKIYVVGGRNNGQSVSKCEVYDPKVDGWSSVKDLIPLRIDDRVAAIGGELFVYGGLEWREDSHRQSFSFSRYVAVYNPVKNEWRQLGHITEDRLNNPWVNAFFAEGKFHTITLDGIDVYDMDTNSWSNLYPFPRKIGFNRFHTWALDHEIVMQKCRSFYTGIDKLSGLFPGVSLVQRGLGSKIAFEAMGNSRLGSDLDHLSRSWNYDFSLIQL